MSAQLHDFVTADAGDSRNYGDLQARLALLESKNVELEVLNRQLRIDVQRLQRLAYLDPLTGLGNRRHFDAVVVAEIRRAARTREPLSFLICDVDRFKDFNDAYGHEVGDTVLIDVARVLSTFRRRGGDLAVRYAGDEFALLLPGLPAAAARPIAKRLGTAIRALSIRAPSASSYDRVTVSIGGTTFHASEPCSPTHLVETADRALYRAKHAGRNRAQFLDCS